MSGLKSQTIGSISEKATLSSLVEFFTYVGIEVVNGNFIQEEYNKVVNGSFENNELTGNLSYASALLQARGLGKELAHSIIVLLVKQGYTLKELKFIPEDTSANTTDRTKTDDLQVTIYSKKSNTPIFKQKFSQKTKTTSAHRMDGNSSGSNVIFLEKLFSGTNLLEKYPAILELGSDLEYRESLKEHKNRLEKIKKENNNKIPLEFIPDDVKNHPNWKKPLSSAPDVASILVNKEFGFEGFKYGNKSNNNDWKTIAQQKLKLAFEYATTLKEYENNIQTIGKNLKELAGIKEDVHMAISAKESPESSSTVNYVSLNCKKYNKLVAEQVNSIYINNNRNGGIEFEIDGIQLPIDYVPNGLKFCFDLLKYVLN